jgi:phage-related protein
MEFTISYYEKSNGKSPVEDFLNKLKKNSRLLYVKTIACINKMKNSQYHKMPLSKHLEDDIFEIRVPGSLIRVLYAKEKEKKLLLLMGIKKPGQKIDQVDIETAKQLLLDHKKRNRNYETN